MTYTGPSPKHFAQKLNILDVKIWQKDAAFLK